MGIYGPILVVIIVTRIQRYIYIETWKMAPLNRLTKELKEINDAGLTAIKNLVADESNMMRWTGLLVPNTAPYNKGAFRVEIKFPDEYPFKPPKVTLLTKIYHPNVDEKGQVCLPIVNVDKWKPATKSISVINALADLIDSPDLTHPTRPELAEEYMKNKATFIKNAEEFTRKHGEKRPSN